MWPSNDRASTPTHSRIECPSTPRTVTCAPRPSAALGGMLAGFTATDSISGKSLEDLLNAPRKKMVGVPHPGNSLSLADMEPPSGDDDDGGVPEMLPSMAAFSSDDGDDGMRHEDASGSSDWLHRQHDERTVRSCQPPRIVGGAAGLGSWHTDPRAASMSMMSREHSDTVLADTLAAMTVNATPVRKKKTAALGGAAAGGPRRPAGGVDHTNSAPFSFMLQPATSSLVAPPLETAGPRVGAKRSSGGDSRSDHRHHVNGPSTTALQRSSEGRLFPIPLLRTSIAAATSSFQSLQISGSMPASAGATLPAASPLLMQGASSSVSPPRRRTTGAVVVDASEASSAAEGRMTRRHADEGHSPLLKKRPPDRRDTLHRNETDWSTR